MNNRDHPPALGERAAKGGYHPQDRLSAQIILTSLRRDTLEWIRLADVTAGRVDDFQLASPGRVDAYQIKWTFDGGSFTYRELVSEAAGNPSLIAQLADGWTRLKNSHPQRRVVVHFQTNRVPSVSRLIKVAGTTTKKSFSQFINELWRPVRSRNAQIPSTWRRTWNELRRECALAAGEFRQFVTDCELEFGVLVPNVDSVPDPDFALQRDLVQVTDQLQALAADPTRPRNEPIQLDRNALLALLNWTQRLEFVSRHDFPEPKVYREIPDTAGRLRVAIQHLHGGYLVLLGDPGSGKSTLLTKTLVDLPCRLIRYYAFVPDARDPHSTRGEAANFLHDLTTALDRAGFRTEGSLSDFRVDHLLNRLYEQMALLHEDWKQTGRKTLILVDGLDHIPREQRPQRSLLTTLPDPDHIPDGVLFILGSQTDQLEDVVPSLQHEFLQPERRIEMGRLSRLDVVSIANSILSALSLTTKQHEALYALVGGHPLALSLILNRLSNVTSDAEVTTLLESSAPFDVQIDSVYFSHWRQLVEDPGDTAMKQLLGRLARLRRAADLRWVSRWAAAEVLDRLRLRWYHLFAKEDADHWTFFHNSFRQFLLNRTAEVPRRGFDPTRDREIHADLADLCASESCGRPWCWDEAYHRQLAGQHDRVLDLVDSDRLKEQLCAFRPVEEIDADLRMAVQSAGVGRDFLGLCKIVFAGMEVSSRKENLSHLALHQRLLELGEREIAIQHVHDGHKLRLDAASAIEFSQHLVYGGSIDEASRIFRLCEPVGLLKSAVDLSYASGFQEEDISCLDAWAGAVAQFRPLEEVCRLIRAARFRGRLNGEPADQTVTLQARMLYCVAVSLVDDSRWQDLSNLLEEIEGTPTAASPAMFWLYERAWNRAVDSEDDERGRSWLETAQRAFPEATLADAQKIALAEGVFRILRDKRAATSLLGACSDPTPLAVNFSTVTMDALMPYLRRYRLMYALGEHRGASELVPDSARAQEQPVVYLERGVSEIARLWAAAWTGNTYPGTSFVAECGLLLRLFDHPPEDDDGRHVWHMLSAGRGDFYTLLTGCAEKHGSAAVEALFAELENAFCRDDYQGWPVTDLVTVGVDAGASVERGRRILARAEEAYREREDREPGERISWRNDIAQAWSVLGEPDRARGVLIEALRCSAGIGARKDYQLDEWIKWLRKANALDSYRAAQRIRGMVATVAALAEYAAGRMTGSASTELIRAAMDWSPVGAVDLIGALSEAGATSYLDGATTLIQEGLKGDEAASDVAVALVAHVVIPIATTGNPELLEQLIRAVEHHGRVELSVLALQQAIDVLALPSARGAWRTGLREGLVACGRDPDDFGIPASENSEEGPSSEAYGKLRLNDGTEMTVEAVAAGARKPTDLYELLDREDGHSFFDWTDTVSRMAESLGHTACRQLSAELRRRFADGTRRRWRQTMPLLAVVHRQQRLGDEAGAWETALYAANRAEPIGWDRHWDTGSKQQAYAALVKIDPARGKQMAFESLVTDLMRNWWHPGSVAMNLNDLAPLVCEESVPVLEVWNVIRRYLDSLFPAGEGVWDIPRRTFGNDTISTALADALCVWLDGRVPVMKHGAMRACVDLLLDGNETIRNALLRKLDRSGCSETSVSILMVLDAVGRQNPRVVEPFREHLCDFLQSPDQGVRWTASEMGRYVGINVPVVAPEDPVLHHYGGRTVIELPPRLVGTPRRDHAFDTVPDSLDPYETIAPWTAEAMAVARVAELPTDGVVLRVLDYMRELSPERNWNADAERTLRQKLEAAQLKLPFRRPRAAIARRALYHVVRELRDGGVLSDAVMEQLRRYLRHYDAELLVFRPERRPREVDGVAEATFRKDWVDEVFRTAPSAPIRRVGEWGVVGERTVIKPAGERGPREIRQVGTFHAAWGLPPTDMDAWKFFCGLSRETLNSYAGLSVSGGSCVVLHHGTAYDTPGENWLAFDPELARDLGWTPVDGGLFEWRRGDTAMAKSVWWSDGLTEQSMEVWKQCEVAEGWLVMVSEEAVTELEKRIGAMAYVGSWTRTIFVNQGTENYTRTSYFKEEWN